jgi:hypothetical protein
LQIKTKIVSSHTADSKPVKQEVNCTVILPPLVFPALLHNVVPLNFIVLFKNIICQSLKTLSFGLQLKLDQNQIAKCMQYHGSACLLTARVLFDPLWFTQGVKLYQLLPDRHVSARRRRHRNNFARLLLIPFLLLTHHLLTKN